MGRYYEDHYHNKLVINNAHKHIQDDRVKLIEIDRHFNKEKWEEELSVYVLCYITMSIR